DRAVLDAAVVPEGDRMLAPVEAHLPLGGLDVVEQELEERVALVFRQLVDLRGLAAVDVEQFLSRPRMHRDHRVRADRIDRVGSLVEELAADVDVQLAEVHAETPMHLQVDRLAVEEDHAVLRKRVLQLLHLLRRKRSAQIDVVDLGPHLRRERLHGDGRHGGAQSDSVGERNLTLDMLVRCNWASNKGIDGVGWASRGGSMTILRGLLSYAALA